MTKETAFTPRFSAGWRTECYIVRMKVDNNAIRTRRSVLLRVCSLTAHLICVVRRHFTPFGTCPRTLMAGVDHTGGGSHKTTFLVLFRIYVLNDTRNYVLQE